MFGKLYNKRYLQKLGRHRKSERNNLDNRKTTGN